MEDKTINNQRHINYLIFKLLAAYPAKYSYLLLEEPLMLTVEKESRRDVRGVRGQREYFYTHLLSKASATCARLHQMI